MTGPEQGETPRSRPRCRIRNMSPNSIPDPSVPDHHTEDHAVLTNHMTCIIWSSHMLFNLCFESRIHFIPRSVPAPDQRMRLVQRDSLVSVCILAGPIYINVLSVFLTLSKRIVPNHDPDPPEQVCDPDPVDQTA